MHPLPHLPPPGGRGRLRRGLAALAMLAAPLAGVLPAPVLATSVHRCTDARGTVSYSQQPCPAHTEATQVQASDTRSAAQRREAEEVLRRDKALVKAQARQARQAQLQAEREGSHRQAGNLSGPVRQVGVGSRAGSHDVDRRGTPAEPLRHNPRQFRAKTPKASSQATPQTSPAASGR